MPDYKPGPLMPVASPGAAIDLSAHQPAQRPVAGVDACVRAIERVEQIVEQETFALKRRRPGSLGDFNHRKSHGLLELTRALRALGDPAARQSLEPRLRALQGKVKENGDVLKVHLEAVQEIATSMARAIRDGESDGTYSAAILVPCYRR